MSEHSGEADKPAGPATGASGEGQPTVSQAVAGPAGSTEPVAAGSGPGKRDRSTLYWVLAVVTLLCVELYFYGKNGEIRVCVAKEGFHDFNLMGQPRTDENRWKFPYCEDRTNLGLRGEFDELARDAVKAACRRATLMQFKNEQDACIATEKSWRRKVITRQVMPWERPFYRRLFWLERR